MKYSSLIILCFTICFCSCQKVINVNLNSSTSKYVVTGNVTDQPGPYIVQITKTIDFSQDNNFPGVSGALVVITDSNTQQADTLTETTTGKYQTHTLAGVSGHTYLLSVAAGGSIFTSSSTLPQPVALDSVYTTPSIFGSSTDVAARYIDPVGVGNYYHLLLTVQDSVAQNIYIHDDELIDGNVETSTLRTDIDIKSGNKLTVELQCVDHATYQYYQNLEQTIQQNSATPANPQSNINGGALGYFSAHTVSRKIIFAP